MWDTFGKFNDEVDKFTNVKDVCEEVISELAARDKKWSNFPQSERTRLNATYEHLQRYVRLQLNYHMNKVNDHIVASQVSPYRLIIYLGEETSEIFGREAIS